MNRNRIAAMILLLLSSMAQSAYGQTPGTETAHDGKTDTVHVAPPTGDQTHDRASILAALARVQPGGTIQFAPGAYLVGEMIRVDVPRVTLLGHPEGTTLRGCDPDGFSEFPAAVFACNGLELTGGHQTVRNLTFEYAWHGLHVGCCNVASLEELAALQGGKRREPSLTGGYRIEGNSFRNSPNGIRVVGEADEPTVIRGNRFVNTYHAVVVNGRTAHVLDNDVSVPEPEHVPFSGHPGGAIAVSSFQMSNDQTACAGNVIAGNRVEGHPDAIAIVLIGPGTACRNNEVRDNTIVVRRVRFSPWMGVAVTDQADGTVVGVPLALLNIPAATGHAGPSGQEAALVGNVIEGNHVIGAEGVGIEVLHASGNRIVNNTIQGVRTRNPFPGNTLMTFPGFEFTWGSANGSGIWVSAGSDENEIVGNTFEDVATHAIVLEGDRNTVEARSAGDAVRDLGSGNRVMRAGRPAAQLEALYRARMDSARTRFSAADVRFVSGMIGHHGQAIVMSRLAPSRDASPAVRLLAERIINAQEDEIALLQQWLRERGQPVPEVDLTLTTHGPAHAAHAYGMLTGEQLRELEAARAREFDRLFLESMIRHHLGAITMVEELFGTDASAQDPAVSRLAAAIQADQTTEIVRIRRMLAELALTGRIR